MENKTNFTLITPSQTMINQEVEMVVVPGSEGHFGVLSLHAHTSVSYTHLTLPTNREV